MSDYSFDVPHLEEDEAFRIAAAWGKRLARMRPGLKEYQIAKFADWSPLYWSCILAMGYSEYLSAIWLGYREWRDES